MIRKDRTQTQPLCQFGIECRYLRQELEEGTGPGCKYYHPPEHVDRILRGATSSSSSSSSSSSRGATSNDPLRSLSKVPSFTPSPSASSVSSMVSPSSSSSSSSPLCFFHRAPLAGGVNVGNGVFLFLLSQAAVCRSSPDASGNPSPPILSASSIVCGSSVKDGDWLRLQPSRWCPVAGARSLPVSCRVRCFRLLSSTRLLNNAIPSHQESILVPSGSILETTHQCELSGKGGGLLCRLGRQENFMWILLRSSECDEEPLQNSVCLWRVLRDCPLWAHPMRPSSSNDHNGQEPSILKEGSLVCSHLNAQGGFVRMGDEGAGGWAEVIYLRKVKGPEQVGVMDPPVRNRLAQRFLVHPYLGSAESVSGELKRGEKMRVSHRHSEGGGEGAVWVRDAMGRGWVMARNHEGQELMEAVWEEEEQLDGEQMHQLTLKGKTQERSEYTEQQQQQQQQQQRVEEDEDDSGKCVVCLVAKREMGLLHGNTMHKCVCSRCSKKVNTCPICRAKIDQIVKVF